MWTLLFLFGYGTSNSPAQVVPLPYFQTKQACLVSAEHLTKAVEHINKQSRVYDYPLVVCLPSQ